MHCLLCLTKKKVSDICFTWQERCNFPTLIAILTKAYDSLKLRPTFDADSAFNLGHVTLEAVSPQKKRGRFLIPKSRTTSFKVPLKQLTVLNGFVSVTWSSTGSL